MKDMDRLLDDSGYNCAVESQSISAVICVYLAIEKLERTNRDASKYWPGWQ